MYGLKELREAEESKMALNYQDICESEEFLTRMNAEKLFSLLSGKQTRNKPFKVADLVCEVGTYNRAIIEQFCVSKTYWFSITTLHDSLKKSYLTFLNNQN